jgi:hypothetical protein
MKGTKGKEALPKWPADRKVESSPGGMKSPPCDKYEKVTTM